MARGGAWSLPTLVEALRVAWEAQTPPGEWLAAALLGDPRLWRLPDGTWVHLGAVTGGRCITTARPQGWTPLGLIPAGVDLQAALLPFEGWDRIPVTTTRGRGMLERGSTPSGRPILACPPALVPTDDDLLGVIAGPEGVRLETVEVDPVVDLRHRRTLARHARGLHDLAPAPDPSMALPRRWSGAELLLALLAADPTACTAPTTPLSTLLEEGIGTLLAGTA